MAESSTEIRPPSPWLMLLEGRAPWEYAATLAVMPWLSRLPRGDGHPVIVFPGLGASELSTRTLRGFLGQLGYATYDWGLGHNRPRDGLLEACRQRVLAGRRAARPQGQPGRLEPGRRVCARAGQAAASRRRAASSRWARRSPATCAPPTPARAYELVQRPAAAARPGARRAAAARAAGAHHLDLQQDRRRGRLAMQPQRATRRTPRTSRSTPATSAWA